MMRCLVEATLGPTRFAAVFSTLFAAECARAAFQPFSPSAGALSVNEWLTRTARVDNLSIKVKSSWRHGFCSRALGLGHTWRRVHTHPSPSEAACQHARASKRASSASSSTSSCCASSSSRRARLPLSSPLSCPPIPRPFPAPPASEAESGTQHPEDLSRRSPATQRPQAHAKS